MTARLAVKTKIAFEKILPLMMVIIVALGMYTLVKMNEPLNFLFQPTSLKSVRGTPPVTTTHNRCINGLYRASGPDFLGLSLRNPGGIPWSEGRTRVKINGDTTKFPTEGLIGQYTDSDHRSCRTKCLEFDDCKSVLESTSVKKTGGGCKRRCSAGQKCPAVCEPVPYKTTTSTTCRLYDRVVEEDPTNESSDLYHIFVKDDSCPKTESPKVDITVGPARPNYGPSSKR